jgi:hypothetical protein
MLIGQASIIFSEDYCDTCVKPNMN